ncbi:DapH/DapD/GlmU-related protein [Dysgonomonas sp. 25]|uniref:acyltransferase n=1 Tax=Dysgonomonas sp. 25 TaxID=2302933 RepID=UPI0013D7AE65|nr:acyltransferase [Dysgonomonas sp. 25]NDV69041.1 acyltransferase [Dysgonomonas sp. 25]
MIKKVYKRLKAIFLGSPPDILYALQEAKKISFGLHSYIDNPMQIDGGEFIRIGDNSSIGRYAWLGTFLSYNRQQFSPSITIGNNVRIGNYACITAIDNIEIGDGCLFSEYIYISDHAHGIDAEKEISPKDQDLYSKGPVKIGKNTFVGYRASILPGVTLGKHCVVGANSVVTKSFPDYSMVAGIPARLIKTYSLEQKKWINVNHE